MTNRPFRQVDVFGSRDFSGNPLAVVLDAEGLSDDDLRRISVWTNLSECTFVQPPTTPDADYRVRIFSLANELPFAGHPTLGTARAWLDAGGVPSRPTWWCSSAASAWCRCASTARSWRSRLRRCCAGDRSTPSCWPRSPRCCARTVPAKALSQMTQLRSRKAPYKGVNTL